MFVVVVDNDILLADKRTSQKYKIINNPHYILAMICQTHNKCLNIRKKNPQMSVNRDPSWL